MKVFRSTELSQSIRLARPNPSGVAVFFSDDREPRTPGLAVASGPTVFIYRNLRPYFKYTLPRLPIDSKEEGVWEAMRTNELDITEGWNRLSEARDEGAELSVMSVEFLALEDPEDQRAYVQENANTPLERTTVISCLTTLFKKFDDPGSVSYLVLGTENKEIVILQQEANNIMTRIK
ncbi:Bbs1, partial [Symbiodinium sp. KB8]